MAKVKLHRCNLPTPGFAVKYHPCALVQKALDEQDIEYEVVHVSHIKGRRKWVKEQTGQKNAPVIEFEDGSAYREESGEMAARIKAGKLFEADQPVAR
jgi:glutaredoxin